ncbi:MAG: MFS transporter [Betaproteobacteria bacterium RIFCSPLOWO2_12_FULL_66_14]|nr:MAG: MFS transporter [Betaproteobacteria bacterium RIFCSPLOWO2_12_FULL_66_14]
MSTVSKTNAKSAWLPRPVIFLALVSFLNDIASDIVIPLIPIVLATVLAAGPAALGLVEGVADALAALLKLWAGRHSDRAGGRRKPLVIAGYVLSNLARPLIGLSGSWMTVLLLRSLDRVGKGIRSAPRDAMIGELTPPDRTGLAFGFHRALDNFGAVLGGLTAAVVVYLVTADLATVLLLSAIPGAACVLLMVLGVQEPRKAPAAQRAKLPPLSWAMLSPPTRRYLLVLGLFTFARVSETFLVLRGHELGAGVLELLLLWSALNAAKALASYPGGAVSDRLGRRAVLLASWTAYAASFYFLSRLDTMAALWIVVIVYGAFAGFSEGAERALIDDMAPPSERGTAFGWYYLVAGLAAIPAAVLFGALWQWASVALAFSFAAAAACASALLLLLWVRPGQRATALSV